MKALPTLTLTLLAAVAAVAQQPAPAAGEPKVELKADATDEPKVKLDGPEKKDLGDAPAPAAEATPKLPGVDNLTEEQSKLLIQGMGEVSNYLRGVRWQEALEKLADLEEKCGENHYIANLRGAVYTRMRDFNKARVQFVKAVELTKGLDAEGFHPKFNLAELDFVTRNWDAARTAFQGLLKDPGKPGTGSDTLINFKIFICDLQQKKEADADVILSTFDQYDAESPAYYYAHAAKLFIQDKKDEANEWLESAKRIYPKEVNEVYNDSLVEMGWLETLQ